MEDDRLATSDEVAAHLRTTTASLANDRYRGVGPKFIKRGRRVLYKWADVREWERANTLSRTDGRPGAA